MCICCGIVEGDVFVLVDVDVFGGYYVIVFNGLLI